ncbi:LytTR family DNA-binding domain-containing protein [Anaerovorax odorimutans]|uniref:Stage 0 sporulation protein A homolog n=1 Tax=Anaerovorax odorimutans TaxID=109327 RepID=A0ABT1RNL1_9FIRM|nr:LytTR family DNA-binding domain-containing protein [Anaerovorax odorimutans]MCQ4636766.1 LytTR family DNA-binding domain-containing protein [Anaerovorax odorimutans]
MWRILICDDDAVFLELLKKSVIRMAGERIKEIRTFEEKEKIEFYAAEHPNEAYIVFLDVELGEGNGNGVESAKQILNYQPNSQIIFISAHDKYYLDVYEVDHVFFLKKPLEEEQLEKALHRAAEKLEGIKKDSFAVTSKKGVQKLGLNEILYFEKEKRKIHIHTVKDVITYYGKFDDMEPQLDHRFLRCHNSYIVNISKVKKMGNKKFYFENDKVVPISKSYYPEVRDIFLEYLEGNIG